jgi:threonine synthase
MHDSLKMVNRCASCGSAMRISYDYALLKNTIDRKAFGSRAPTLWKYKELLPISSVANIVTLGEGWTPLVATRELGPGLGLKRLYLKDETRLPTGSLKDRCATVSISKAVESGVEAVVVSSSGNGASSMAAYAARAGVSCYVFVPSDAPTNKLIQSMAYGAKVTRVKGGVAGTDLMAGMVGKRRGWPNLSTAATYNPYALQGQKTGAYEIAEQLGWKVPDWVVLPVGSGNVLAGQWAGFGDLLELGLIDRRPKLAAVQAAGCAPFADAFRRRLAPSEVKPWGHPDTIAGGVRDEYPFDVELALPALRESGGTAVTVTDQEIMDTAGYLARKEGVFVEPTGAVATAGLRQLVEDRAIDEDEVVVTMLTGSGLKDPQHIGSKMPEPPTVEPGEEAVTRLLQPQ